MNLLAVNTSGFSASLALGISGESAGQSSPNWTCVDLNRDQNTAQFLVPAIKNLLESKKIALKDIDRFAVTSGPGSFTGLRIGITTVKSLAYAMGKPVFGINSLAAIAQNAKSLGIWDQGKLSVIINAFRSQFFFACFDRTYFDQELASADQLTATIGYLELENRLKTEPSILSGPGLSKLPITISNNPSISMVDFDAMESARGVGELAWQLDSEQARSAFELLPNYFRESAAEEKRIRNEQP